MSEVTSINKEIAGAGKTVINPDLGRKTSINYDVIQQANDVSGVMLGNYVITQKLDANSGEADLYLCEAGGKKYVSKMYRRPAAIKAEIAEALKVIDSPYIAKTIEIGTYNEYPYEILEYYPSGSIQGKILTETEIKKLVVQINSALHTLHSNSPKILHKDLKPSNIMIKANGDYALIDFGISSVVEGDNTVVATRTGLTLDYSAPEALRGVFLEESDYYSLGITIYELVTGKTPFRGMTEEQLAQYTLLQQIPFQDSFPESIKRLVQGLTFNDITHRHEKDNPNRRWTYEEVAAWCNGTDNTVPGHSTETVTQMPPYSFEGQRYTDYHSLALAFSTHWESGKKHLFRKILSGFFMSFDQDLASYCMDAEESDDDDDVAFFKVLYYMDKNLKSFCWKGTSYPSLKELGTKLLSDLRSDESKVSKAWEPLWGNNLLSIYVNAVSLDNKVMLDAVSMLEKSISHSDSVLDMYRLAYLLSDDRSFVLEGTVYHSLDELSQAMKNLLSESFEKFSEFCSKLIGSGNKLNPQFEAWLIALGKIDAIENWRASLVEDKA